MKRFHNVSIPRGLDTAVLRQTFFFFFGGAALFHSSCSALGNGSIVGTYIDLTTSLFSFFWGVAFQSSLHQERNAKDTFFSYFFFPFRDTKKIQPVIIALLDIVTATIEKCGVSPGLHL